mmetsp:Transcript_110980/g.237196  ORF Transcript_110980/g.237196 Transcript_110980/m.237196 type:complete len:212 (-) Transcript_110980:396-1031(-)
MDGIEEMLVVDQPHKGADDENNLGKQLAKVVQLLLERGFLLLSRRLLHSRLDVPYLCGHARGHNYAPACAVGDRRRGKEHVGLRLDDAVGLGDRLHFLGHALRLPRQLRLLDADSGRLQLKNPQVGRDLVADLHLGDISRHEVHSIDSLPGAPSDDRSMVRLQLLQGIERLLSIRLLPDPDERICDQDQEDHERLDVCGPALLGALIIEVR